MEECEKLDLVLLYLKKYSNTPCRLEDVFQSLKIDVKKDLSEKLIREGYILHSVSSKDSDYYSISAKGKKILKSGGFCQKKSTKGELHSSIMENDKGNKYKIDIRIIVALIAAGATIVAPSIPELISKLTRPKPVIDSNSTDYIIPKIPIEGNDSVIEKPPIRQGPGSHSNLTEYPEYLKGTLRYKEEPISGAVIYIEDIGSDTTDQNGRFEVLNEKKKKVGENLRIHFSHDSFKSEILNREIFGVNENISLSFDTLK